MKLGGDGDDVLASLGAYGVYALLIPESAVISLSAFQARDTGSVETLNDGAVLYVRPGLTVHLDQRNAPNDESFGGRLWEVIGTITVSPDDTTPDSPAVDVLIAQADAGVVVADGVRLRKVDEVLPNLRLLTLENNPLDDRAHDYYIPLLESRMVESVLEARPPPPTASRRRLQAG
jgi:hypothetical protein